MMTAIFLLLGLISAELAVLIGLVWATSRREPADEQPPEGADSPSAPPASGREEKKTEEFEKRWRDGMDAMMEYDMNAARKAVRRDGEERE